MDPTYRLPDAVGAELLAQAAGDRPTPVPRDAASVILMRDGATEHDRPEVFFLQRHRGMAFAGGMAVFPGGSVDASDDDADVAWFGLDASAWAERLGTTEPTARALVVAAIRELFEETGVLLAGTPTSVVTAVDAEAWEEDRRGLEAHEISFADILRRRELTLRTDLLAPWAEWITPEFEPRRYATRFFVAALPAGQHAQVVSSEAKSAMWSTVHDAIAAADSSELLLLPPQYCNCLELYDYASVDAVLAANRDLTPVRPKVGEDEAGRYLIVPEPLVQLGVSLGIRMYGDETGHDHAGRVLIL